MKTLDTIKLIEASGLPTSQRMLLVSLAMLATGTEGVCFASVATLEERTGLSRAQVQRNLRALEEAGWVNGRPSPLRTTEYRITPSGGLTMRRGGPHHEAGGASP